MRVPGAERAWREDGSRRGWRRGWSWGGGCEWGQLRCANNAGQGEGWGGVARYAGELRGMRVNWSSAEGRSGWRGEERLAGADGTAGDERGERRGVVGFSWTPMPAPAPAIHRRVHRISAFWPQCTAINDGRTLRPEIRPYRHCYQSCFGCVPSAFLPSCGFKLGRLRASCAADACARPPPSHCAAPALHADRRHTFLS